MKIAIVGHGFVGKAVEAGFRNDKVTLQIIDPIEGTSVNDLNSNQDVVFICVPTPQGEDLSIDLRPLESVIHEVCVKHPEALVVLKSTVVPSVVQALGDKYPNFVYNPEFLTERNAINDFLNPFMQLFGSNSLENAERLAQIFTRFSNCKDAPFKFCKPGEAAFVKYGINSFLALKVAFFNQFSDLINQQNFNYNAVADIMSMDERVGFSHMNVPGNDYRRGFGGSCFAKDIPAIVKESEGSMSILREAWNYNCSVRNSYEEPLPREVSQNIRFKEI